MHVIASSFERSGLRYHMTDVRIECRCMSITEFPKGLGAAILPAPANPGVKPSSYWRASIAMQVKPCPGWWAVGHVLTL